MKLACYIFRASSMNESSDHAKHVLHKPSFILRKIKAFTIQNHVHMAHHGVFIVDCMSVVIR